MSGYDILFLDDMEDRWDYFKFVLGFEQAKRVLWVKTAQEAIENLMMAGWSQVFLDHDLSEEDIMSVVGGRSKIPTGMVVADFICTMKNPPSEVIVHSHNDPAGREMVRRMVAAGVNARYVPFIDLADRIRGERKW